MSIPEVILASQPGSMTDMTQFRAPKSGAPVVPEKPTLEGLEERWGSVWETQGAYRFDRTQTRENIFSIDTPPPTVSGSLHVGHVFSYTHTDLVARFQRMRGKSGLLPDGLGRQRPADRAPGAELLRRALRPVAALRPGLRAAGDSRTPKKPIADLPAQLHRAVRAAHRRGREGLRGALAPARPVGRLDAALRHHRRRLPRRVAAGVPAQPRARRGLPGRGADPVGRDFQTAVAQAELEDRERPGAYHRIAFHAADGDPVEIETTRPELLPACVALVAHPDDERYQPLFGTTVRTPLFGVEVPVLAHRLAEPDKGSGIAMVCTFGDLTDVHLVARARPADPRDHRQGRPAPARRRRSGSSAGRRRGVRGARRQDRVQARESDRRRCCATSRRPRRRAAADHAPGEVLREGRQAARDRHHPPVVHPQRRPRRRTCATTCSSAAGELDWHPPYMRSRYENWVEGLNGDWLISRQRFFGVPFPVWYPLDADGEPDYDAPDRRRTRPTLPVDPSSDAPPGLRRGPARRSRAASSATPTSWTPGRRRR